MIPIYQPWLDPYKKSAMKAIEEEWISNYGIFTELASHTLKEILKIKYCLLMNNGTSATHCLFKAIKFKYPTIKKIYVPNNVFAAVWNCGLMEYSPDCFEVMKLDHQTMNIDTSEKYFLSLEKESVVVIVHNLGNIVNVPRLKRIRPDLIFVEDNCEGFFGTYENQYSGTSTSSLCSSISFYANKTITTGEGGAFLTNDLEVYNYMKTFHSHGMSSSRYIHNVIGTNYRMTNIQAGFLYDQLQDYETILARKRKVFDNYLHLFEKEIKSNKVKLLQQEEGTSPSYWMFIIRVEEISYPYLEKFLLEKNIQVRPIFYDVHRHRELATLKKTEDDPFTDDITDKMVMLPSYPTLTWEQQQYIHLCIQEALISNNLH